MKRVTLLKIDKWWSTHYGTMLAFVYLVTATSPTPPPLAKFLSTLGIFTIAVLGIGSFGQLLNDLTDVEQDARTGARNILATKGSASRMALVATSLVMGIVPWWWLPTTPAVAALVAAEYALFVLYSVPPFRLKERGFSGIVADALYAYVVPNAFAILLFANLGDGTAPIYGLAATLAWCFCFGIERILFHELLDAAADARSGVRTFVVRRGWTQAFGIDLYVVVPLTTAAFVAMLTAWAPISPILPVSYAVYAMLTICSYWGIRAVTRIDALSRIDRYHLVAERLICAFVWRWLGLCSLATLVTKCPQYLPLVPLHLALFPQPITWARRHALAEAVKLFRSCSGGGRSPTSA